MNAYDPNPPSGEPIAADDDIDSYDTLVPQITLITKHDVPSLMSKRISLLPARRALSTINRDAPPGH